MNSPAWTGMLPVDDTELYVNDTGGLGLGARMSADQHADINIELNEIAAASVPVLERLTRPVSFVLATGDSLGSEAGEMEQGRKVLDEVLAANPNVTLSAKVASNHSKILRNDSPAVARVVRELDEVRHG